MNLKTILVAGAMLLSSASVSAEQRVELDPSYQEYERVPDVYGSISSMGSDTMANLMASWAVDFQHFYPSVRTEVQAAGSATAPIALTQGAANVVAMSRKMVDSELEAFENKYGYQPTVIPVAIDVLAVYVHKDNPIEGFTLTDLDSIFSATRRCGASEVTSWGQLGLEGKWQDRSIQLFGRNSLSGTYAHFKRRAMCFGDFKKTVNEQPGSASVVQSVASTVNAIGYSGIGYNTVSVKAVPLAAKAGDEFIEATAENALNQTYPLSRFLFIYVNKAPNTELAPVVREFLKMIMSRTGQEEVLKNGYVPLPLNVAERFKVAAGI